MPSTHIQNIAATHRDRCSPLLRLAMLIAAIQLFATLAMWDGIVTVRLLAEEPTWKAEELSTKLTVGYAVRLLDMNQDNKLDIAIVDSERILWLENPTWQEHVLIGAGPTKKDNVCFAPYDIDGDGKLDFAVGAEWNPGNTASGGTIQWIRAMQNPAEGWQVLPIGEEPTTHRMLFADLDGDGRAELVVAPLLGRDTTRPNYAERGVRLLAYKIPAKPATDRWVPEVINDELHVTHNLLASDMDGDGQTELLLVSFEGVHLLERKKDGTWKRTRIGTGNQTTSPNRGASEIRRGRLANGNDYLATIEPWHGSQVVVYTRPKGLRPADGDWLWNREVLDEELTWGHAVTCANLDDDPDEELVIGVRDDQTAESRRGLRIYDPKPAGAGKWTRSVIDPGGVAIEDLSVGDLDGDKRADIVTVGRQTHNVKIYWNRSSSAR